MVILTLLVLELLVLPLFAKPPVVLLLEEALPLIEFWEVELFWAAAVPKLIRLIRPREAMLNTTLLTSELVDSFLK